MALLWDEWLGASENWKTSTYAITLKRSHSHEKVGARRWMTFKQLCSKYDDVSVAESIRENKKTDPFLKIHHCKPHPDCPKNPATRLHSHQPSPLKLFHHVNILRLKRRDFVRSCGNHQISFFIKYINMDSIGTVKFDACLFFLSSTQLHFHELRQWSYSWFGTRNLKSPKREPC